MRTRTRKNRKVKKGGRTKNNNINNLVKKLSSITNRNVTTLKKNMGLNKKNKKSSILNIFS